MMDDVSLDALSLDRNEINGKRHYEVQGDNFISVTAVTDEDPDKQEAINHWKKRTNNPGLVKKRKGIIGTLAHHRILNPLSLQPLELPEVDMGMVDDDIETDVETCIALWEDCDFEIGPNPHVERRIASFKHEYAGTFDLMTTQQTGSGERTVLVDLKTSKAAFHSHKMQLAAYYHAIREWPELPNPDCGAIIVLHPDPSNNPELTPHVEWLREPKLEEVFDDFLKLLRDIKG